MTVESQLPWSEEDDGIGGHSALGTEPGCSRTPVVFVHGNGGSHES